MKRRKAVCRHRSAVSDERGQSLVEFVLALPILLVIIFGIVEFAAAWRSHQVVTNVAREGARLAVLPNTTDAAITAHIDTILVQSGLNLSLRTITISCQSLSGTITTNCTGTGVTGTTDIVQVDYLHTFVVLGPVLNLMCTGCGSSYGTVTLRSRSAMRNEG